MANQDTINKVKSLLEGHCYAPLKAAAENWLAKIGTDEEAAAEAELKPTLIDGVATVEEMLVLFDSEAGAKLVGPELAGKILEHAKELKANGEKYCDCDACKKALSILADLGVQM